MAVRSARIDDIAKVPLNEGVRFGADLAFVGRTLGTRKMGIIVWEIPPGLASTPFHAHQVNEELAWVVAGRPRVRLTDGEHALAPGDVVALPAGHDSAHQFLNRSGEPAIVALVSTRDTRDIVEYPDTGRQLRTGLSEDVFEDGVLLDGDRVVAGETVADLWAAEQTQVSLGDASEENAASLSPRIATGDSVPWEACVAGPFRSTRQRLAVTAGAGRLGCSRYRIEPGDQPWPFHFHHVNEEVFFVVAGAGEMRTADGWTAVGAGAWIFCPTGPDGAHAFRATGDSPLDLLALSTMEEPEVNGYPDSGKVFVMVGAPPGGEPADRVISQAFRLEDAVSYLDGEPSPDARTDGS